MSFVCSKWNTRKEPSINGKQVIREKLARPKGLAGTIIVHKSHVVVTGEVFDRGESNATRHIRRRSSVNMVERLHMNQFGLSKS